ncbi:MAG: hypothetical protein J6X42_04700 [Alphaproteobacteria bacterium]|nr:hypothetical protein [Alphaproteobacteria bacterium]
MRLWDEIAALFDAYDEEEEERKRREEEERKRREEEERQEELEKEERERQEALEGEREQQEKLEELAHKEEEERVVQKAYEHLKKDGIEGYSQRPYCDDKGKNTVGVGYRIPNYSKIKDLTMTSQNAPASDDNPAWDEEKKRDFIKKLDAFCEKEENSNMRPNQQKSAYYAMYSEEMPYFQEEELEDIAKKYIRKTALPEAEKNMNNLKMDFYKDLNPDAQTGLIDMQYNLGGEKFKLIDLYDHQQIDKSPLKFKEELKANPMRYLEKEINDDLLKNGYWPGLSMGLKNRDVAGVQGNLHRDGVGQKRQNTVQGLFNNPFRENNAVMPKDNLSQGGLGQNGLQPNALEQNPYSQIMPVKSQEEEDLEELLKRLRRMRRGW